MADLALDSRPITASNMTIGTSEQLRDKWRAPVCKEIKCGEFFTN